MTDATRSCANVLLAAALACGSIAGAVAQSATQVTRPGETAAGTTIDDDAEGTARVDGHVTGADGSPVPSAHVVLMNVLTGRTLSLDTNVDGGYQFEKVPAGLYEASAKKTGYVSLEFGGGRVRDVALRFTVRDGESVGRVDFTLPRVGAIVGRVADENGDPVQGAIATAYAVQFVNGRRALVPQATSRATDDLGRFRLFGLQPGRYLISAAAAPTGAYRLPGYLRSFYPASSSPGAAQPVDLATGDDVAGVEVRLTPGATGRVSGLAETAEGRPFTERITIAPTVRSSIVDDVSGAARPSPEGAFAFQNLSPGEYVIKASTFTSNGMQFAEQFVDVEGDLRPVALRLAGGSRVTGRISFEGDASRARPKDFAFMFQSVDPDQSPTPGSFRAKIQDDWTFDYNGLFGPMLMRPSGRAEWLLKSIRVNGVDVIDTPIAFGRADQSLSGVDVVFTNRGAQLSAAVADGQGRPASICNAVVFSTDRLRWDRFTRFVKTTRCDPDGTITVRGLPSGDYYVLATDRPIAPDDRGTSLDPAYLESLIPAATHVTLAEGQTTSAALRIASGAR
jgi:hypothetical protein